MSKKGFLIRCFDLLWDMFCIVSVIGLWPRFLEPRCIVRKFVSFRLKGHRDLDGLKILHFSDLHFRKSVSKGFLSRLITKTKKFDPDIIVFTGDFICNSKLEDKERLKEFLCSFSAPYGCYYTFGNHDYSGYISRDRQGKCKIYNNKKPLLIKVFKAFFTQKKRKTFCNLKEISPHKELTELLSKTPFQSVENKTISIPINGTYLNISGLGDYWAGCCCPEKAFKNYIHEYLGIVLTHNPDSIQRIKKYPGDIVLGGHTHGGQANFPFLVDKFVPLDNKKLRKGLFFCDNKNIFVTKGVGSTFPFRWFAPPELVMITLEIKNEE